MAQQPETRRTAMVVAGWLAAAVLSTGVTLAAVSSIGTGIFGSSAGPLDRQEINEALATPEPTGSPTEPAPTGSPTEPAPTDPVTEPSVITSAGGTVVARCAADDLVELLSWSPAQGFSVDNAEHGPAREVEVEFESEDDDVEMKIRCVDGVPVDVDDD
ncbi:MAG TPA: hypothetical protein VFZ72_19490 [Jiangellaceae bacterium]